MTHSAHYKETVASTSPAESPLLLLEISHADLAEPIRVVNDTDDFPYGSAYEWQANHVYAAGEKMIPPSIEGEPNYNGRFYQCTVGGASGATVPALPATVGQTVVDNAATWSCAGNQFKALAFRVKKPDDMEQQLPRAELAVDNIGRELVGWLEQSGGGRGASCRMMEMLRSDPSVIEWEVTLDLTNIQINALEVSGSLGFEDLLNKPAVPITYRPDIAPGLF